MVMTELSNADNDNSDTRPLRMGFLCDVAGYGGRRADEKERAQQRVEALIHVVLSDLNVKTTDIAWQGTGDGMMVFLPSALDIRRALPQLLHSMATHLAVDNKAFVDQIQLRMAVDIGPVGMAKIGFKGGVATNLGRLVSSEPPRKWLADDPKRHLAAVIADRLHFFVVAENVPALPPAQFKLVHVQVRETVTTAWLWVGHDPSHP